MSLPGRDGPGQAFPSSLRGAALVGLAVIVGIIGLQILDDSETGTGASSTPQSTTSTTMATQTSKPHTNRGDVKVKVYNASDVQGAGQQLTDKLKGFGYATLPTANFPTTQKGTVVQCRSGFEPDGQVIAVYGIGNGATSGPFPANAPEGSADANCIVILGTT
jgi:hypothetical protein